MVLPQIHTAENLQTFEKIKRRSSFFPFSDQKAIAPIFFFAKSLDFASQKEKKQFFSGKQFAFCIFDSMVQIEF